MGLEAIEVRRAAASRRKAPRVPVDKLTARRVELAEAALETLGELGYARTSLREIAQNSAFTHGVFHYYFADKNDLICFCVRHYKAKCVKRYDQVVATAQSREALMAGFLEKLSETLRDEAPMHRLWYDLRAQAMFEQAFREDVAQIDKSLENMIWRIAAALRRARRPEPGPLVGQSLRAVRRTVPEDPADASVRRPISNPGLQGRDRVAAANDRLRRGRVGSTGRVCRK